ncbi:MAG: peptidoglycan -binding protein, partial [Roseiarcus sp.]
TAMAKLNRQIEELTNLLAMERTAKNDAQSSLGLLSATLDASKQEQARLQGLLAQGAANAEAVGGKASAEATALDAQKEVSARALAEVDILNQQIAALRRQLAAIEDALAASEASGKDAQTKIADLGSRLNTALAQKVQELARYRSDFFGRLRQILGSRPGIRVVGDRFVFESSVLFDSARADISPAGHQSLDDLAAAVIDLEREIPPDLPWILRIDGHTDKQPISGGPFRSNWELSSARAIAVVQYLITKGIPPERLAAAGFGEFQPIDPGQDEDAFARNRRIELKLTER